MALQIGSGGFSEFNDLADVGDDELINDLADVGALQIGAARRRRRMGGKVYNARRIVPTVPGAPSVGIKLQPLGFNTVTFTATSGTALAATTRPQKPFKGKRLVVDIARTGATSTGLITVTNITIGVNSQFVSTGAIGAAAFAATAFDVNMELSACSTALDINVNYATTLAPTAPDNIAIATTMFGEAVGS